MNPLIDAIINNDAHLLAKLMAKGELAYAKDTNGFSALELAQFLGHYECQRLLEATPARNFLVQKKGESRPTRISQDEFEQFFNITYRPSLYFDSYSSLQNIVKSCPYILRSRYLASDNYAWSERYLPNVLQRRDPHISIRWINDTIGYGAFAEDNINMGEFIGEYTGLVRRLLRRHADPNAFCFHYPTCLWSIRYAVIDALRDGNLMRFVNHGNITNIQPLCLVDRGLLHLIFVASKNISQGSELLFDYGRDFWRKRLKHNPF